MRWNTHAARHKHTSLRNTFTHRYKLPQIPLIAAPFSLTPCVRERASAGGWHVPVLTSFIRFHNRQLFFRPPQGLVVAQLRGPHTGACPHRGSQVKTVFLFSHARARTHVQQCDPSALRSQLRPLSPRRPAPEQLFTGCLPVLPRGWSAVQNVLCPSSFLPSFHPVQKPAE